MKLIAGRLLLVISLISFLVRDEEGAWVELFDIRNQPNICPQITTNRIMRHPSNRADMITPQSSAYWSTYWKAYWRVYWQAYWLSYWSAVYLLAQNRKWQTLFAFTKDKYQKHNQNQIHFYLWNNKIEQKNTSPYYWNIANSSLCSCLVRDQDVPDKYQIIIKSLTAFTTLTIMIQQCLFT